MRSPPDGPEYDGLEASRLAMVEITSVCEERPKLSAKDRLCLIQTINALPPTQFEELVFALDPPKGVVAPDNARQGQRSKDLLDWLESSSGPGLATADEVLQVLIPQATKTAPQPVAFVMMGRMGDLTPSELEAIAELLRQKTGDPSIALAFSRAGSIKLILNGSPEGLAQLQEMFEAGELEQLNIPPVEAVAPIDTNSQDAHKARLIQTLRIPKQPLVNLAISLTNNLAQALNNDTSLAQVIAQDLLDVLTLALSHGRYTSLPLTTTRYHDLPIAFARARAHDLANDINQSPRLTYVRLNAIYNALSFFCDHSSARNLDLSSADLSGANLRDINLTGAALTGADLTYADVTGTIFKNNSGLTDADKRDLQSRGAIFLDPPSSDVPALVLR